MSLTTDGVWKAGVWASTVWGDCVWFEPHCAVETFSGGYFDYEAYRPRKIKAKKEDKKVAKIIEDVAERQLAAIEQEELVTARDLEISIRISLRLQGIIFKKLYMDWIRKEAKEIQKFQKAQILKQKKRRQREEEELIILLLH